MASATLTAPPERLAHTSKPDPRPAWPDRSGQAYTCPECEHVLRVSGLGRHRMYFQPADERSYDPVMNRGCPECGHGLPGKNSM